MEAIGGVLAEEGHREERSCAVLFGAALWGRECSRTPEACERALAERPKLRGETRAVGAWGERFARAGTPVRNAWPGKAKLPWELPRLLGLALVDRLRRQRVEAVVAVDLVGEDRTLRWAGQAELRL